MQFLIAFATVIGSALVTYLGVQCARQRRRLGYEVLFAGQIVGFESKPDDPLQVMVRNDALGLSGSGYTQVTKVYGFRVQLKNTGNAVLQDQIVSFQLDHAARIASIQPDLSEPTWRTRGVTTEITTPNIGSVTLLFLNQHEEGLIVNVQSVENDTSHVSVYCAAPGLKTHDIRTSRRRTLFVLQFGGFVLFMGGYLGAMVGLDEEVLPAVIAGGVSAVIGLGLIGWYGLWMVRETVQARHEAVR